MDVLWLARKKFGRVEGYTAVKRDRRVLEKRVEGEKRRGREKREKIVR